MKQTDEAVSWVVYKMTVRGKQGESEARAVCEQVEWDAMERDRPGYHALVQDNIATEGEAERLARGTSGDPKVRGRRL